MEFSDANQISIHVFIYFFLHTVNHCKCALFNCEAQSGSCPDSWPAETSPVKQELSWLLGKSDLQ